MQQAIERLDQTLQRDPNHLDACRLKGQLDLAQDRPEDALRALETVVQRRPYDTLAREALGRALRNLSRTEEANAQFEFVARAEEHMSRLNRLMRETLSKPEDAELRYEIGAILFEYGPPEDAAKWMRAALELQPDHAAARQALAAFYESRGDAANAAYYRQRATPVGQEP
jgi:tetratricopeptide (TPR) repeat protein